MNSRLGLGLYSLAGVYGKKDRDEIQRLLLYAVAEGIEFFDVADRYGPAEEILGTTLKHYRSRIKIATKVGVCVEGGFDLSYEYIQRACRRSLKRLQTDFIDLYQVHFDDPKIPVEETIGSLEDLQRAGLVREYGLGHLPLDRVKEYAAKGRPFSLMMELSPVAVKRYKEALPFCRERGLKIIAMGTTGRGILTGKIQPGHFFEPGDIRNLDPLFQRSLRQSALHVLAKLQEMAAWLHRTPVQVALAWVLGLEGVEVALVGPSRVEHLRENLGGAGWELPAAARRELDSCIEREEEWKIAARYGDIRCILENPLSNDRDRVMADLVYALEGIVELDRAAERQVLPLFEKLMAWYRHPKTDAIPREIQNRLSALFFAE